MEMYVHFAYRIAIAISNMFVDTNDRTICRSKHCYRWNLLSLFQHQRLGMQVAKAIGL